MKQTSQKAQSALEYTLLMAAVIGIMVLVLLKPGGMTTHLANAYNNTSKALSSSISTLTTSAFK
jgi:hypothetical protein